jgi:spermidine synthase
VAVLGVLFTFTGCTALLAEQAFERLLSTLIGASTPAAATVLAVYFGGLTLGGLLYGRLGRNGVRAPLRVYALLEGAVALWALVLTFAFDRLVVVFAPILSLGVERFWQLQALRFGVAMVWILPLTIPMGATFPAMVESLERMALGNHRRVVTRFYGRNLLGAIAGSVLGPYLLFPAWGLDGVLRFVFLVNATVAAAGLLLARAASGERSGDARRGAEAPSGSARIEGLRVLLPLAVYSGFQFFALEVLWTHLIGTVLGNSVYAFAAMLGVVLAGLGLGAWITSLRHPHDADVPLSEVGTVLVVAALFLAATASRWPDVPGALVTYGDGIHTFGGAELLRWSMAVLLLLPTAVCLGMVYPTLLRLREFPLRGSGPAAGRLTAANALGSIAGALLTGFVLIPRLGSEATMRLLTVLAGAIGIGILWRTRAPSRRPLLAGILALVLAVLLPRWDRLSLTSGQQVYFATGAVGPATILRFFHEDALGGFTTVVQNKWADGSPYLVLLTNGKFQGNDKGEMTAQTAFALVPTMFTARRDDALCIGLGTGRTAFVLRALGFPSVDVAEIAPGIAGAAPEFSHINGAVLTDPRAHLFLEDGRNLLLLRPRRYDLITAEISSIWFAGSTNLYSREFYRLVRSRLKPDGVLQQWVQLHHLDFEALGTVLATVAEAFPYVSLWNVGGQGLITATARPQSVEAGYFDAVESHASALGWDPKAIPGALHEVASGRLLSTDDVAGLVRSSKFVLNTDRNRRLEYLTPRYNHLAVDYPRENMKALRKWASFPPMRVSPEARGPAADAVRGVARADYLRVLYPGGDAAAEPEKP